MKIHSSRRHIHIRYSLIALWFVFVLGGMYLYLFQREFIQSHMEDAFSASAIIGYGAYLLLGSVRGFTLIPATYLIVVGLLFFPPLPLFLFTLAGILISSTSIYYFSESLHIHEYFQSKHSKRVEQVTRFLQKHELPVVIGWSFFPLAPTDIICYVCGLLEVNFKKFLFGVAIGEGAICALYIFFGGSLLELLRIK